MTVTARALPWLTWGTSRPLQRLALPGLPRVVQDCLLEEAAQQKQVLETLSDLDFDKVSKATSIEDGKQLSPATAASGVWRGRAASRESRPLPTPPADSSPGGWGQRRQAAGRPGSPGAHCSHHGLWAKAWAPSRSLSSAYWGGHCQVRAVVPRPRPGYAACPQWWL